MHETQHEVWNQNMRSLHFDASQRVVLFLGCCCSWVLWLANEERRGQGPRRLHATFNSSSEALTSSSAS